MRSMANWSSILVSFGISMSAVAAEVPHVQVKDTHIVVDGKEVPYLFGAELQYFRARGGSERNVPRDKVIAGWNKLLDRVQEAKMNTAIFYIPWDFHEPVEGVFDFDGSRDDDRDGNADYPSRDLKTFLKMVADRGLRNIMLRPGPYINAEWGPEGFGAIPKWFLDNYPDALAVNQTTSPKKARVASFRHPEYLARVERWFRALAPIIKPYIGPGKPVAFLQIDNETNYFWDSVYERDWHPSMLAEYKMFIRNLFKTDLRRLKREYGDAATFTNLEAPKSIDDKRYAGKRWHYDWYLFHDVTITNYYKFLRYTWEHLGIYQPDVLFTSCDSFNSLNGGLLPRLDFRQKNRLTLTTMNVYPKTFGSQAESTLNTPMKAAYDAALVAASHRQFYGNASNWVMSSETVGGWFPPTEVSLATRQHTYGSLIGTGIKALIIYYFHEGWNWSGNEANDTELNFDAPLDRDLNPRPAFDLLKSLGHTLASGLGDFAMNARPEYAPVLLARDSSVQYSVTKDVDAQKIVSNDAAGWYGFLREAGYAPEVGYLDHMAPGDLARFKVMVWDHPGYISANAVKRLDYFTARGGTVVTTAKARDLPTVRADRIVLLANNPSLGWNEDYYAKIPDAPQRIASWKSLMSNLGLAPLVNLKVSDNEGLLHAWVRRGPNANLVFIENFARKPREVHLQIPGVQGTWKRVWGGKPQETRGQSLSTMVEGDTIEIWTVE